MMPAAQRRTVAAMSGALLALAFPWPDWSPLAWIALVPLLSVGLGGSLGQAFRTGWLGGLAFFVATLYWIVFTISHYTALSPLVAIGPLLLLWGLREHWVRRKRRAAPLTPPTAEGPEPAVESSPPPPESAKTRSQARRFLGAGCVLAGVVVGFVGSPPLTLLLGWIGFAVLLKGSLLIRIGLGLILGQLLMLPFVM